MDLKLTERDYRGLISLIIVISFCLIAGYLAIVNANKIDPMPPLTGLIGIVGTLAGYYFTREKT